MTFDKVLTRVLELLQRQGRVSYSALKNASTLRTTTSTTSRTSYFSYILWSMKIIEISSGRAKLRADR